MIKFIKSNIGTLVVLTFAALIAFNPTVKGMVLRQLVKTGLFNPDVEHSKPAEASGSDMAGSAPAIAAPSVTFSTSAGETIDIAKSKGKVVFVNFWATWCPPCIAEMPSINALRNKFKDNKDMVFVMADVDNKLKRSEAFMKKNKYDLPVYEPVTAIPEQIFRGSIPTTLIVDKNGNIVFLHEGMADYNSKAMQSFLTKLLK